MIHKEFFQQPKAKNMNLKCTKELHKQLYYMSLPMTYNNNQQGNGKMVKDSTGLMPFILSIHNLWIMQSISQLFLIKIHQESFFKAYL